MPSIIDPAIFRGGASTATRGMISVLEAEPLAAEIDLLASEISSDGILHSIRRVSSVARSMFSPLSSKALFHYSRDFRMRVREALASNAYDLVLVNGSDLLWVLNLVNGKLPVVVWAHNLEYELYARQLDTVRLPAVARSVLKSDLNKLKNYEMEGMARADGLVFLSASEADRMQSQLGNSRILCVPPLFTYLPRVRRRPRDPGKIIELGFLANLDWWPNADALSWFLEEILPHCGPGVRLKLFGVGSENYRSPPTAPVIGYGYVSDIATVWNYCDVMICPIRKGGGVNIKLAEAIYNGMPVLATPFATDGLPLDAGPALAIAETADQWIEILSSPKLHDLAAAEVPAHQRGKFASTSQTVAIHEFFINTLSSF